MVLQTCNPNTQEAENGELLSMKPAWATVWKPVSINKLTSINDKSIICPVLLLTAVEVLVQQCPFGSQEAIATCVLHTFFLGSLVTLSYLPSHSSSITSGPVLILPAFLNARRTRASGIQFALALESREPSVSSLSW